MAESEPAHKNDVGRTDQDQQEISSLEQQLQRLTGENNQLKSKLADLSKPRESKDGDRINTQLNEQIDLLQKKSAELAKQLTHKTANVSSSVAMDCSEHPLAGNTFRVTYPDGKKMDWHFAADGKINFYETDGQPSNRTGSVWRPIDQKRVLGLHGGNY